MRKKSKRKPREIIFDCMHYVKTGLSPLESVQGGSESRKLRIKNHSALGELVRGQGTRAHADIVIESLNITEALAMVRDSLGADWRDEIKAAQDALLVMLRRGVERGNRFVFTAQEMTAVNLAMEIHDQQLSECTVAELEKALRIVLKVVRLKRARKLVVA